MFYLNFFQVLFVDYGNEEVVPKNKMKEIPLEFLEIPKQAVICRVNAIQSVSGVEWPRPPKAAVDKYYDSDFNCTFHLDPSGAGFLVDLKKNNINVIDQLVNDGLANYTNFRASADVQFPNSVASVAGCPIEKYVNHAAFEVQTSFIESCLRFWCQPLDKVDILDDMMEKIDAYYAEKGSNSISSLQIGTSCVAQYSEDGGWYRARVLSASKGDGIQVYFVDYGNNETVDPSVIRSIEPSFCSQAAIAFECKLNGVPEIQNKEFVAMFQELVSNKVLMAKVESINNDVLSVLLTESGVNINEHIVSKMIEMGMDLSVKKMRESRSLAPGQAVKCIVMHVESANEIYVMKADDEEKLYSVTENLQDMGANGQMAPVSEAKRGNLYVVQFSEDDSWYRAVVKEVSDSSIVVHFIDYGNSETTSLSRCREIIPQLESEPGFCICCSLDVQSTDANSIKEALEERIKDEVVDVLLISSGNPAVVNMTLNGMSVKEMICGLGADQTEKPKILDAPEFVPKYRKLDIGTNVSCSISYSDSHNSFFVTPDDTIETLEELSSTLQTVYENNNQLVSEVVAGHLYAVKFSEDENWYRAVITNISGNEISVRYIDFGNSEVTDRTAVREMDPSLADYQAFAIECSLGLDAPEDDNIKTAFDRIISECETVSLSVLSTINETTFEVSFQIQNQDVKSMLMPKVPQNTKDKFESDNENVIPLSVDSAPLRLSVPTNVEILHIVSPEQFYVSLQENQESFQSMVKELQDVDYSQHESIKAVQIGKYYSVQYSEDLAWYRAVVTSVSGASVCVHFIDYGNSEVTDAERMRPLPNKFYSIPSFAIYCGLDLNIVDDAGAKSSIEDLTSNALVMQIVPKLCKDKKYIISLLVDDISVDDQLVSNGLAQYQTEMSIQNGLLEPMNFPTLNLPCTCKAILLHAESVNDFYVTPVEEEQKLNLLSKQMKIVYEHTEQYNISEPNPSKPFAVKYSEDNLWYRAKIIAINGADITVQFLDYGNIDTVTVNQMKHLLPEFKSITAFGINCKLTDFEEPELLNDKLLELLLQPVTMEVVDASKTPVVVNISELLDVASNLLPAESVTQEIGTCADDLKNLILVTADPFSLINIEKNSTVFASISFAESPNNFYIQVNEHQEQLEALMHELIARFDSSSTDLMIQDFANGMACVVQYSEDEAWYRAKVLDVNVADNTLTVHYVDYGNTDTVDPASIRKITKDSLNLSAQAIPCVLYDANGGKWTDEQADSFMELVSDTDKQYVLKFVDKVAYKWRVQLLDIGLNVAEQLKSKSSKINIQSDFNEIEMMRSLPARHSPEDKIVPGSLTYMQHLSVDESEISIEEPTMVDQCKPPTCHINCRQLFIGSNVSCTVSHVDSIDTFFVMPINLSEKLEELSNTLHEQYENCDQDIDQAVKGQNYVVKFSQDENWYRGTVTDVSGDSISVRFIDFGNCEVTDKSALRCMNPNLAKHDAFAIECCLHLEESDGDVTALFQELASEYKTLHLSVLDRSTDGKYKVRLESCGEVKEHGDTSNELCIGETTGDERLNNHLLISLILSGFQIISFFFTH